MNVVHILLDDAGWGDLGSFNGHPNAPVLPNPPAPPPSPSIPGPWYDARDRVHHLHNLTQAYTPNMDALAKGGTVFADFHSAGAVCSPSRVGWVTGRVPATLGVHNIWQKDDASAQRVGMPNWLNTSVHHVARLLRDGGGLLAMFEGLSHGASGRGVVLCDLVVEGLPRRGSTCLERARPSDGGSTRGWEAMLDLSFDRSTGLGVARQLGKSLTRRALESRSLALGPRESLLGLPRGLIHGIVGGETNRLKVDLRRGWGTEHESLTAFGVSELDDPAEGAVPRAP